ncbi:ABC transporter substrate-binding protein [Nakamurella leprariae]|uniref:ABC transporter substrate-binding protein n=1 Tax=Nakamurella leprariae TaxID=2803911 RepID=A0A939C058_9ACTN|nr:ABC transporter substrate-binding protein [Nakamurella leprariae]MBM9465837.1 ABC transporter substrate-binding protein [Nakamurella leprariae]
MNLRRRALLAAPALALVLLTSACGSSDAADSGDAAGTRSGGAVTNSATSSADATPTEGGSLSFAVANDPISLNPSGIGSGNDTLYVTRQLFDSLTEQDPETGEIIPWLAETFGASDDATSFTFTLREGVTFSDGTPLTAESVKATFDDIKAAGANAQAGAQFLGAYDRTEVTDDRTFTVHFTAPNGSFLQGVSSVALAPVAASTLAIPFDQRATGEGVIGTGPFVLDHYTKNTEVVLTKRDDYDWGPGDRENTGAAHLDEVVFKIVPESGVRTGSLDSGQVQVIGGVAPQDNAGLEAAGHNLVVRANPGISFGLTAVETQPIVADEQVRLAIARAINATDVRDAVLDDHFAVATSPLAANTPGWVDLSADLAFDPEQAASLLDEAGWTGGDGDVRTKDGQPLHLVIGYISNFGPNQGALELIQQQLRDVGIEAELWTGTVPDYLAAIKDGKIDLAWGNLSRADGDVLRTQYSTASSNYYKIDDPELEAALVGQASTADPDKRAEFQATAQELLVTRGHTIPVHELTTVLGADPSVHGVVLGADSRLSQLTDAFIAE